MTLEHLDHVDPRVLSLCQERRKTGLPPFSLRELGSLTGDRLPDVKRRLGRLEAVR